VGRDRAEPDDCPIGRQAVPFLPRESPAPADSVGKCGPTVLVRLMLWPGLMPARCVDTEHAVSRTLHEPVHGPRVLLAENDLELRRLLVKSLERGGFQVTAVSSGEMLLEALTSLLLDEALNFDILVTDVQLPRWSGLTALNAMRCAGCKLPVILLTACPDPELLVLAKELAALLLTKPFDLDELNRAVAACLSMGAAANAIPAPHAPKQSMKKGLICPPISTRGSWPDQER
jgi:CheY-like chemotaxis protein